jgi:hypothetical protein
MAGSNVFTCGGIWSTMKTDPLKPNGKEPTKAFKAVNPPAEAPTTMMSFFAISYCIV